jgi:hypothetical protein
MEVHEASRGLVELGDDKAGREATHPEERLARLEYEDRFRRAVALWVALVTVLLALTTMARDQSATNVVNANIHASDTYNFFQAKNIRQTDNQIAANELGALLQMQAPSEALRTELESRLAGYLANVARYESEPETGEGKQELLQQARAYEAKREKAKVALHSLHFSSALLQIAIVLGSVAILAVSRPVFISSTLPTGLGLLLLLNGYFLHVHLPV